MRKFYPAVLTAGTLLAGIAFPALAQSTIPLCEITRNLTQGMSGEDVRCLQRYLNWAGFTVAASGPGSPGNETAFFGALTKRAVIRWQDAHAGNVLNPIGLTSGTGFWGSRSFGEYVAIVKAELRVQ